MKQVTSRLLMLIVLGVFIQSSDALRCYQCLYCYQPASVTCDDGDVCVYQTDANDPSELKIYILHTDANTQTDKDRYEIRPTEILSIYALVGKHDIG